MEYRYVNKSFVCYNCGRRFKKLVNCSEENTTCIMCNTEGASSLQDSEFNRENLDRTYRLRFDHSNLEAERQYHPSTDLLDRDPNNIYGDPQRRVFRQTEQTGQQRQRTFTTTDQQSSTFRSNQQQQATHNRFPLIFRTIFRPYNVSPFHGSVFRHVNNFGNLFDNILIDFSGPTEFFMDNFASNFSSNFQDPLTRIVFIESMQNQPSGNPPASKNAIKNLKTFKMSEEYCKKDEKGNFEFPSCSVCLTEVNKDEETILVPCGHMFHAQCIIKWLEMHNTCPVCRYELPTDDADYNKLKQERNNLSRNEINNNSDTTNSSLTSNGRFQ